MDFLEGDLKLLPKVDFDLAANAVTNQAIQLAIVKIVEEGEVEEQALQFTISFMKKKLIFLFSLFQYLSQLQNHHHQFQKFNHCY